jgi:hypothetical protein
MKPVAVKQQELSFRDGGGSIRWVKGGLHACTTVLGLVVRTWWRAVDRDGDVDRRWVTRGG